MSLTKCHDDADGDIYHFEDVVNIPRIQFKTKRMYHNTKIVIQRVITKIIQKKIQ